MDHVPLPGESREQWKERLAQTAPVRRRAKEIYVELKTKDDAASSVSVPEPRMATTTTTASSSGH